VIAPGVIRSRAAARERVGQRRHAAHGHPETVGDLAVGEDGEKPRQLPRRPAQVHRIGAEGLAESARAEKPAQLPLHRASDRGRHHLPRRQRADPAQRPARRIADEFAERKIVLELGVGQPGEQPWRRARFEALDLGAQAANVAGKIERGSVRPTHADRGVHQPPLHEIAPVAPERAKEPLEYPRIIQQAGPGIEPVPAALEQVGPSARALVLLE
jgi:hypothetical protein